MSRNFGDKNHNNEGMPRINGKQIVGVKKNEDGDILDFKLETGEIVGYQEAMHSELDGLIQQQGRDGEYILRSSPDGRKDNNLDNLPTYE